MARLFISYKREEQDYAFALRQWLMSEQSWSSDEIFIDRDKLRAGETWAEKIFAEAEKSEVMLFIASNASLQPDSFCYKELQRARGVTLAVTIKGLSPSDERLHSALPHGADARQIAALDGQPTHPFPFVSPIDGANGSVNLNKAQVESIGQMLRDLGVAPNSFKWIPTSDRPYPGLAALQEGDEAIFFGRDLEIRDCIRQLDDIRKSATDRVLMIQAPSGAGKSSFLRAGLWRRLRRHSGFTPLAIVRTARGSLYNEQWGLVAGLAAPEANLLRLTVGEIEERVKTDLGGLLGAIADADLSKSQGRRTLLLGIDQAEEIARLEEGETAELGHLLAALKSDGNGLDFRLVLTVRDDSIDPTLERLQLAGFDQEAVKTFRLHRMPQPKFTEVINGPAAAARRANYPLDMSDDLAVALAGAVAGNLGRIADSLPILALALQRVVKKHRAPDGRITLKPSMADKFIGEAVADATRDAIADARCDPSDLRKLIIPQLVTWDPRAGEGGAAKRQVASETSLFRDDRTQLKALANELVNQRLLTRSSNSNGAFYEVAHEALLRAAPLGDLIKGLREKFLRADVLNLELQEWKDSGRKQGRLARTGERLREAEQLVADEDFGTALSDPRLELTTYLAACAAKEREDAEWRELAEKYRAANLESARRIVEPRDLKFVPTREHVDKLTVYITYSRRDHALVEKLQRELTAFGIEVILDVSSIQVAEDWKQRLVELIGSSDSVVFVVSPDSLTSSVCQFELEHAVSLQKRIVPVLVRPIDEAQVPERLRSRNFIYMSTESEWALGLASLEAALSTDIDWVREHTRIGELATRWDDRGRANDLLLRGSELEAALQWRKRKPRSAPGIPHLQKQFLDASDVFEADRRDTARRQLEEREALLARAEAAQASELIARKRALSHTRIGAGVAVVLAVAATGLAFAAYQQRAEAEQARFIAEKERLEAVRSVSARSQLEDIQKAALELPAKQTSAGPGQPAFTTDLTVRLESDGRTVVVAEEFVFRDGSGAIWTVPKGTQIDGSSIPQAMWSVVGSPLSDELRRATVLHDYFSQQRSRPAQSVNRMFYEAMIASGVTAAKAQLLFVSVERFGPRW